MRMHLIRSHRTHREAPARLGVLACCCAVALALAFFASAQQPGEPAAPSATPAPAAAAQPYTPPDATNPPAATAAPTEGPNPALPPEAAPSPQPAPATPIKAVPKPSKKEAAPAHAEAGISEAELKQMLIGKALYLRGGYLSDTLNFDEHGHLIGHSPQGSFTLCAIQIDHLRLTKHKLELEGLRYGLHFSAQLAYEDSATTFDRVQITPKKKFVHITIDREIVVKPKKEPKSAKNKKAPATPGAKTPPAPPASEPAATTAPTTPPPAPEAPTQTQATPPPTEPAPSPVVAEQPTVEPASPASESAATTAQTTPTPAPEAPTQTQATQPASPAAAQDTSEMSEADQLKASIASVPEAERPADPNSVTTTTSPAHANRLLKDSLSSIFAEGLDQRMMAEMPAFWKFYYQAAAAKVDYRPSDPSIYRQNTVDQKAMLLSKFEPDSNEYAQANGIAGMALYHTVVNTDGKAGEIAIARPIGFGLDENAVAAIRKASFQPAVKDGKPVAVLLDLVVQFRIFSKRTSVVLPPDASGKPEPPILPGPYSVMVQ